MATGTLPLSYQWRLEGTDIPGATTSDYTRMNVQTNDLGHYSVLVTNVAGTLVSSNALLTLLAGQSPHFDLISILPDQRVQLTLSGEPGNNYVLEISSNLLDWTNLVTLSNAAGTVEFIDDPATNAQRNYRARLAP
jgi:hypothetical protein